MLDLLKWKLWGQNPATGTLQGPLNHGQVWEPLLPSISLLPLFKIPSSFKSHAIVSHHPLPLLDSAIYYVHSYLPIFGGYVSAPKSCYLGGLQCLRDRAPSALAPEFLDVVSWTTSTHTMVQRWHMLTFVITCNYSTSEIIKSTASTLVNSLSHV